MARPPALAAAALSFGAAVVHGSVIVSHFREYWLFGAFFIVVCPAQIAWAAAVHARPDDRRLLAWGAAANLAIVGLWLVTRTLGLPFGPHPGVAEAVHLEDVVATVDEAGIVLVVAVLLARGRSVPSWVVVPAWVLAGASLLVAFAGGGHTG